MSKLFITAVLMGVLSLATPNFSAKSLDFRQFPRAHAGSLLLDYAKENLPDWLNHQYDSIGVRFKKCNSCRHFSLFPEPKEGCTDITYRAWCCGKNCQGAGTIPYPVYVTAEAPTASTTEAAATTAAAAETSNSEAPHHEEPHNDVNHEETHAREPVAPEVTKSQAKPASTNVNPPVTAAPAASESKSGLSGGAIAGIVIASIVVAGAAVGGGYYAYKKNHATELVPEDGDAAEHGGNYSAM